MPENEATEQVIEQTSKTDQTEKGSEQLIGEVLDSMSTDPQKTKGDKELYRALDKCMNDMNFHVNWGGKGAATFAIGTCNEAANGTLNRGQEREVFVNGMNSFTGQKGYPVVFGIDRRGDVYGTKRQ